MEKRMEKRMRKYFVIVLFLLLLIACTPIKNMLTKRSVFKWKPVLKRQDINNQQINKKQDLKQDKEIEDKKKINMVNEVDYSECFKGVEGGAVFYNPKREQYDVYNPGLCSQAISPYSTFKIVSTLISLQSGLIETLTIDAPYEELSNQIEPWSKGTTLQEAFQKSYVWYYELLMDKLDKEQVQKVLNILEYGNCDLSAWKENEHHTFWINSSLQISPLEQIGVLEKIFEKNRVFDIEDIKLLKRYMLVESNTYYKLYGKTGSAKTKNGWFVGFFEDEGEKIYFAVYINDDTQTLPGQMAKKITKDIIDTYYIK